MKKVADTLKRAAVAAAAAGLLACTSTKAPEMHVDAAALQSSLKVTLAQDARLADVAGVEVDARTGVVTLSGRVETVEDRESAGRLACAVKGVTVVYNEIDVVAAPAEPKASGAGTALVRASRPGPARRP
jgi:osmotically-inducible protein OsmY